jgi:hypothetical protein
MRTLMTCISDEGDKCDNLNYSIGRCAEILSRGNELEKAFVVTLISIV